MVVSVTHAFVSGVADEPDASLVRPSNWNAGHVVTGITDEKAKVSSNDTTAGYLNGKLVAGANITLTEINNGGDETLEIASTGGGGGGNVQAASLRVEDDLFFTAATNYYNGGIVQNATGTGAAIDFGSTYSGYPGVVSCSTGSTATGGCGLRNNETIVLGIGQITYDAIVRPATLSTGTQTYSLIGGLADTVSPTTQDGVFFRYTDAVNSGKWECVTRSNNVESTDDSGVTVAANTWYHLAFVVNAAASSVEFFIDGVSVGTITTNIPSGSSRDTNLLPVGIKKSLGATARTVEIDAYWYTFEFTAR